MCWRSGIESTSSRLLNMKDSGSIASRLTYWYALLSAVLIASAGIIQYRALSNHLRQVNDELLAGRISEIRAILPLHSSDSAEFREELQREASTLPGGYLRVIKSDGDMVVAPTRHAVFGSHKTYPPLQKNERGEDWLSGNGGMYRVMSAHIAISSGYTVQVAMSRAKEVGILAAYRRTLWIAILGALIIAIVAGYLIARRSLKPVSHLASMIAELSPTHLNRRVGNAIWPSELRPLAENSDQLLARLEESFARISRFSADIAHELRTPLHILRGEAEMALSKTRTNEDYRACIESATEEYERLTRMVDALLFLARTEQPDSLLDKKSLILEQEIATVSAFYQAMADEQGVVLATLGGGTVFANSGMLQRALGNLVINALRHSPRGGRVSIEGKETPEHGTNIVVSDTGDGIDAEDLPHVFDRFYCIDSARSRSGSGTGLGLAIVKSIMQLHSGTVSIRSEPHQGTVVTLTFPAPSTSIDRGHANT